MAVKADKETTAAHDCKSVVNVLPSAGDRRMKKNKISPSE